MPLVKASVGHPLTAEDIEDVLASLSFEGATVSETVRGLFMAIATGGHPIRLVANLPREIC